MRTVNTTYERKIGLQRSDAKGSYPSIQYWVRLLPFVSMDIEGHLSLGISCRPETDLRIHVRFVASS